MPVRGLDAVLDVAVAAAVGDDDRTAADQRHVALAQQQALPGQVDGNQRGRAGSVDVDAGAGQVELVGHPGRQEVLVIADHHLLEAGGLPEPRVADEHLEQVGIHPHASENADITVERGRVVAGVFQRGPATLQEKPMLGIGRPGLVGVDAEEIRVERLDVGEGGRRLDVVGVPQGRRGHAPGQ
jgi:hypothetical protein